ncbi:DUF5994 family protein [Streptomyces melanogenes]|uniref:DUF5994 family protein n=1 Tax=Streptomyces melanogenes TaxID=67326 RepID=UPI00167D8C5E|nr:DUF5994 family protein [Streptomyces melanogenes]GGP85111.1 hypothetical protein GCM10010278_74450 [Streptomyces melanogenes]
MSATTDLPRPRRESPADPAPTARLALKPADAARGLLDGAWWPRSRDLLSELPALLDVLDPTWARITRIAVNPRHWPVIPRKIPVHGHVVKAGWFTPEVDPHKMLLLSYGVGRWDLLVIPPQTDEATAARLMAAATNATGPPLTASALISAEYGPGAIPTTERSTDTDESEEAWEYEGGAPTIRLGVPARTSRLLVGM